MPKLDLCSSTAAPIRKQQGYTTLDIMPLPGVDVVFDLAQGKPLPFDDDTFDEIRAHDAFEHIRSDLFFLFDECWRVLKPTGMLDIFVPRFPSASAIMHLDHHRYFVDPDEYEKFAAALAPKLNGDVQHLFHVHTWSFFMVPADGVDVHGYLKHFWHIIEQRSVETHLYAKLAPNKPGGRYPYKEVKSRF